MPFLLNRGSFRRRRLSENRYFGVCAICEHYFLTLLKSLGERAFLDILLGYWAKTLLRRYFDGKISSSAGVHFPVLIIAPGRKCFRVDIDFHHHIAIPFNLFDHCFCPWQPVIVRFWEKMGVGEEFHKAVPVFFFVPDHGLN